jgi:hypothetical protein
LVGLRRQFLDQRRLEFSGSDHSPSISGSDKLLAKVDPRFGYRPGTPWQHVSIASTARPRGKLHEYPRLPHRLLATN